MGLDLTGTLEQPKRCLNSGCTNRSIFGANFIIWLQKRGFLYQILKALGIFCYTWEFSRFTMNNSNGIKSLQLEFTQRLRSLTPIYPTHITWGCKNEIRIQNSILKFKDSGRAGVKVHRYFFLYYITYIKDTWDQPGGLESV